MTERVQPAEILQKPSPAARLFPQETSAADAVVGHDPSREKAILENKNNYSADYAQSNAERI